MLERSGHPGPFWRGVVSQPFGVLQYGRTRCYLLEGAYGIVMHDTDLAGTLPALRRAMHAKGLSPSDVRHLMCTHFHPDHMGQAQDLVELGVQLVVWDVQTAHVHDADKVYRSWGTRGFKPVDDAMVAVLPLCQSGEFLARVGISGRALATPAHSADSVSLALDDGNAFVGDLCPREQAALYPGPQYQADWALLEDAGARHVHFAHWPDEEL